MPQCGHSIRAPATRPSGPLMSIRRDYGEVVVPLRLAGNGPSRGAASGQGHAPSPFAPGCRRPLGGSGLHGGSTGLGLGDSEVAPLKPLEHTTQRRTQTQSRTITASASPRGAPRPASPQPRTVTRRPSPAGSHRGISERLRPHWCGPDVAAAGRGSLFV